MTHINKNIGNFLLITLLFVTPLLSHANVLDMSMQSENKYSASIYHSDCLLIQCDELNTAMQSTEQLDSQAHHADHCCGTNCMTGIITEQLSFYVNWFYVINNHSAPKLSSDPEVILRPPKNT